MTARANSLTDHVTRPAPPDPGWSMAANDVRAFVSAFACLGYDVERLLTDAGIPDVHASRPDDRIPCEHLGRLIAGAQRQRFTPNLAVELARVTPLGSYPLLDYLVITSDSAGAGIRQLGRYLRLVGNPVAMGVREDADPIRIEIPEGVATFSVEFTATLMVLHLRGETDGRFAAESVSVRHAPDDGDSWGRVLGCPVVPLAPWNGVTVSRASWSLPLRHRDPVLRQILEARAEDVLSRLPARVGLALEVQRALTSRVAGGDTRMDSLARQLAMSGRTLQRRLAAEGVSYQELLDEARKEAAGRYLTDNTLAICEVAYLLGYSEPAPFHRAFKRWYGVTPEGYRQQRPQAV